MLQLVYNLCSAVLGIGTQSCVVAKADSYIAPNGDKIPSIITLLIKEYSVQICHNTSQRAVPTSNTNGNAPGAIDSGGASSIAPAQPERRIQISAQAEDRV